MSDQTISKSPQEVLYSTVSLSLRLITLDHWVKTQISSRPLIGLKGAMACEVTRPSVREAVMSDVDG